MQNFTDTLPMTSKLAERSWPGTSSVLHIYCPASSPALVSVITKWYWPLMPYLLSWFCQVSGDLNSFFKPKNQLTSVPLQLIITCWPSTTVTSVGLSPCASIVWTSTAVAVSQKHFTLNYNLIAHMKHGTMTSKLAIMPTLQWRNEFIPA